jgi:hypothetical protein
MLEKISSLEKKGNLIKLIELLNDHFQLAIGT